MPDFFSISPEHSTQKSLTDTQLLKQQCRNDLSAVLSHTPLAAPLTVYTDRLESELRIIDEKSLSSYFLIVWDYVKWAKANAIPVGPGRGSGPCSLVGFALGITAIDPVRYQLPFERFFNPQRQMLPDFDVDFCESRREEVTDYIKSKYNASHVAQLSSESKLPLPSRLVICDRPLAVFAPVYVNPDTGVQATTITLPKLAESGLVQFNVINQKALTINRQMADALASRNINFEADCSSLDDSNAYALLCNGEKSNLASLDENGNYFQMLKSIQPQNFENLYATIALSHPPMLKFFAEFLKRKQDPDSVTYYHPIVKKITNSTYGMILFQEQIMNILHEIADFTFSEADCFRRALISSDTDEISRHKVNFIQSTKRYGLAEAEAKALLDTFASPGERYFNKSHAVAFGTIAYQTAWLKARFLEEYGAAGER